MPIVTTFNEKSSWILFQISKDIPLNEAGFRQARMIAQQLIETIQPLMPAAGLAAPQIGISQRVFVYSWDRTLENLEVVINPRIIKKSSAEHKGYEACFSNIRSDGSCEAALVGRSDNLVVEYYNLEGKKFKKRLVGFGAKVFQHEYDHLQGIVVTHKKGSEVKTFTNKADLKAFIKDVENKETETYIKPIDLS